MPTKTLVIALLEILVTYSDEQHILTRPQIINLLADQYQIDIERRTLYNNIELLIQCGYDISKYEDNQKGYYLQTRQFEKSEVNLLCNLIHSSHIIPQNDSNALIDKLLKTQSRYETKRFKDSVYSHNLRKSGNRQFFLNIELINEAIEKQQAINFIYTHYSLNKHRVPRRDKPYVAAPYAVVYSDDNYYMICKHFNHDNFTHYRIDKMQDIKLDSNKTIQLKNELEPYEYAKTKIYMYGGENQIIHLRCDNKIIDDVIDKFGINTMINPDDDKHFIATVNSTEEGIIYWSLQYLKHVSIVAPESIKEQFKTILTNGLKQYQ